MRAFFLSLPFCIASQIVVAQIVVAAPAGIQTQPFAQARSTTAVAHSARLGIVDDVERSLIDKIVARDAKGLHALFSAPMKQALPEQKTAAFIDGLLGAKGPLVAVERAAGSTRARHGVYVVKAERGAWQLTLDVDDAGPVLGMSFGEPPPPEPPVAKSPRLVDLPFRGRWSVFWGGDTVEKNKHVPFKSQRRAADLVIVDEKGSTHRGDGKKNEDYFAYGQDILAVADGTVVTVVDGVPDNPPGEMNGLLALGNTVVIRHDDGLYSFVGHLVPGSTRVKVGDPVRGGQVLGKCGNSGNTSEPHLHVQLQDGPRVEASWGIEARFRDVKVTRQGKTTVVKDYAFEKGDIVEPSAPSPR
jgi:murein DD-endopeptidase MepM/ murein hydrolase activator NlpD